MAVHTLSWQQWRCRHSRAREIAVFSGMLCFTMLWLSDKLAPSVCQAMFQDHTSELLQSTTIRGDAINSGSMSFKAEVLLPEKVLHPLASVYMCPEVPPLMFGNSLKYVLVRSYLHQIVRNSRSL